MYRGIYVAMFMTVTEMVETLEDARERARRINAEGFDCTIVAPDGTCVR